MLRQPLQNSGPTLHDVAIVGAGPTGLTAANILGAQGLDVVVLERHDSLYGLPRAGHIDHEALRILQGIGCLQPLLDDVLPKARNVWLDAAGEVLLEFSHWRRTDSGFPSGSMYQPKLEDALVAGLSRRPNVQLRLGCTVSDLQQDPDAVTLTSDQGAVRARYVIAADGAGSGLRELLGIARDDFGFDERWVVIDCAHAARHDFGPAAVVADPARPHFFGPLGKSHHRFEWKLLPGDDPTRITEPEAAGELLASAGVAAGDVRIERIAVYGFEYRIARDWRRGRVFLMGDAAHTMAPALGQGLCSGMRDAANLGWKLAMVLKGDAASTILDSYQAERLANVRHWGDLSKTAAEIAFVTDPEVAAERDRRFRAGERPTMAETPPLASGLFDADCPAAGWTFPQYELTVQDAAQRSDDLFGTGFLVFSQAPVDAALRSATPADLPDPEARAAFADWLASTGLFAVIVRPDRFVLTGARNPGDVPAMMARLHATLGFPAPSEMPA